MTLLSFLVTVALAVFRGLTVQLEDACVVRNGLALGSVSTCTLIPVISNCGVFTAKEREKSYTKFTRASRELQYVTQLALSPFWLTLALTWESTNANLPPSFTMAHVLAQIVNRHASLLNNARCTATSKGMTTSMRSLSSCSTFIRPLYDSPKTIEKSTFHTVIRLGSSEIAMYPRHWSAI